MKMGFIKILRTITKILATILVLAFFITQVPILLILLIYRSFVWLLAKIFCPNLDCFLTKENAAFAVFPPNRPHKSLNIFACALINGQLTAERIQQLFHDRILNQTNHKNQFVYSRLRQTWKSFLGYAFWKTDRNFSLKQQIREYDHTGELALPNPCRENDISKLLGKLVESPWTKNQSPWEVLVINNYMVENSSEPKTYLILKFDHVLADGYSLYNLLQQMFNTKFSMPNIQLNQRSFSFIEKIGLAFKIPYDLVGSFLVLLCGNRIYSKTLSKELICSVSPSVPVSLIKDIKNHYKVAYATVLQSAVQGAIARAMVESKMTVPKDIGCGFVLPLPNHPGGLVIHAQGLVANLPCQANSSVDRLHRTQERLKGLSNSTAGLGVVMLARVAAYYPIVVRRTILNVMSSIGVTFAISNFPVTNTADYFEGLELIDMVANLGTYRSLGMVIVTGGTNNKQRFGFSVDKNVFPSEEVARNMGCFVLEELQELAQGMV